MSKVHLSDRGGYATACGAEDSWRTRDRPKLDLPRSIWRGDVTCGRCRRAFAFTLAKDKPA